MVRILGITSYGQLKDEALEYSRKYGYPISPDAITGRMNERGQGDVRDAFRHLYGTAVFTYEAGSIPARDIGELGEFLGDNPEFLADMDRKNNDVAISIGRKVRAKFAGVANVTPQQIKDEIAREANAAISSGNATFYITRDNDTFYTPPLGLPDPEADNPGFFGSIGEGLSDAADSVGGFFSSITSGIGSVFSGFGDALTARLGANGGAMGFFQDTGSNNNVSGTYLPSGGSSLNQTLAPSAFHLGQALLRSQRGKLEEGLFDILTGSMGDGMTRGDFSTPPYVPDGTGATFNHVLGELFDNFITAAFNRQRTHTSSQESDRSREASRSWSMSQGQQQAALVQWLQNGGKNL